MSKLKYKQSGHNKYSSNDNKFTVPYLKFDDKSHKFSIDGTKLCPYIQCDIDCNGLSGGCRYAHPPAGKNQTICKFYMTGCQNKNCNRLHMGLNEAYDKNLFTQYKGSNIIIKKKHYDNVKKLNDELLDENNSIIIKVNEYHIKIYSLESKIDSLQSKIDSLESKIYSLNEDIKLKDDKIKIFEELKKSYEKNENNQSSKKRKLEVESEDNKIYLLESKIDSLIKDIKLKDEKIKIFEELKKSYEKNENNQSSKRKLEFDNEDEKKSLYTESYIDFYQKEIKDKNNMIINLTSKLNKILIDNRFMAKRLGWEASQL